MPSNVTKLIYRISQTSRRYVNNKNWQHVHVFSPEDRQCHPVPALEQRHADSKFCPTESLQKATNIWNVYIFQKPHNIWGKHEFSGEGEGIKG